MTTEPIDVERLIEQLEKEAKGKTEMFSPHITLRRTIEWRAAQALRHLSEQNRKLQKRLGHRFSAEFVSGVVCFGPAHFRLPYLSRDEMNGVHIGLQFANRLMETHAALQEQPNGND